jgi:hypothetical protein
MAVGKGDDEGDNDGDAVGVGHIGVALRVNSVKFLP